MNMEGKWLVLLLLVNMKTSLCEDMETVSRINATGADLSLSEFMSKVHQLKKELYARYPDKLENDSFPPPEGSTLNRTIDPSDRRMKHIVITQVYVHMKTDRIVKMDIEGQSLVLVLDELFFWQDQNLTWQDNEGLHDILLKAEQIWTPDIYAENILEEKTIRGIKQVKVYPNGYCETGRRMQYTIPCTINVEKFPFDNHNCSLMFTHPDNTHSRIAFISKLEDLPNEVDKDHVYNHKGEHLEWGLSDVNISVISTKEGDPGVFNYTLMLRRQATFYFTVLILPCIVLNVLSLTVFTLPTKNTDRLDFVLALILTYFVLIMIVVESSPPSGTQIPLLGLYIILSTAVVASTYGMSMVLIEMHEHCRAKRKEMPRYLSRFLNRFCFVSRRYAVYRKRKRIKCGSKVIQNADLKSENHIVANENAVQMAEIETEEKLMKEGFKWKVFGEVLNFAFFLLVCVSHIIVAMVIFHIY